MRIGIDAHAIGSRLGGNETYAASLLSALGRVESPHEFVAYFASEKSAQDWRGLYSNIDVRVFRWPSRLPRLLGELPARAAVDQLDLLHVQFVAPPVRSVPVTALVADISYEFFPQFFKRSEVLQFKVAIRWTARHARRIVTTSESSRQDIVSVYGITSDKIDVTYLGADLGRFNPSSSSTRSDVAVLARYGIRTPYLLAVGNLQPRKNLARLVNAFVDLRREHPDLPHNLVLVGKPAFRYTDVFQRIRKHQLEDYVVFTGYVPDEDLPALYRNAAVFAYPSLYEGFGLPIVEAMACGTPVLTSNRSSMPEVAGDAAVLIDPENARSIANGLLRVLTRPHWATALSEQGILRARSFTWEKTAQATLAAFEAAAKEKG